MPAPPNFALSTSETAPNYRRRSRLFARIVAIVVLALFFAGCQVNVAVDTKVNRDGSGTVSVGVGLNDQAMARSGALQLDTDVKVADMREAGWTVTAPTKEADGFTWIRASKRFTNADELGKDMAEINAGIFTGYRFTRTETESDTTYQLTGTIDTSKGAAVFSETALATQLNGDPFGGQLTAIEAAEGKKVADMVSFAVTATVADGVTKDFHPTLKDKAALPIDVATIEAKPPPVVQSLGIYALILIGILVVLMMLVGVRRRFAPPT